MPAAPHHFIGLMSGTSLDGVDGVLAEFAAASDNTLAVAVKAHVHHPFGEEQRAELLALNTPGGQDELHRAALAGNALAHSYAQVVQELLACGNCTAADVAAIGAHGQTVRHQPRAHDGVGYTLQLNQPALLAERTGIAVVADFRSRDIAAGGQGAPLAPAFHKIFFARPGRETAVLNIGGMSNVTLLHADGSVQGFDCGPGNVLLDAWCQQHLMQAFDTGGQWAATGCVDEDLLAALMAEAFFSEPPPKSTGRDLFGMEWLARKLACFSHVAANDVQATLLELTARSCAESIVRFSRNTPKELVVCGGGALNKELLRRLQMLLQGVRVQTSEAYGLQPMQVEAVAFAWLARQAVLGHAGNIPTVTGACGVRILGAVYPR